MKLASSILFCSTAISTSTVWADVARPFLQQRSHLLQCNDAARLEPTGPRSMKVEENVLTQDECDMLVTTTPEVEFTDTVSGVRFFTNLTLATDLYRKIRDPVFAKNERLEVPISRVLETSLSHRDGYYDEDYPELYGQVVDEEVVLLYLNDNSDAYFVYGEERIPLKCGTKLTFHGGHHHHTEVGSGLVKFLGPVTANSGRYVADYDGVCEELSPESNGGACSCEACDESLGDGDPNNCCFLNDFVFMEGECVLVSDFFDDPSNCSKGSKKGKSAKSGKGKGEYIYIDGEGGKSSKKGGDIPDRRLTKNQRLGQQNA